MKYTIVDTTRVYDSFVKLDEVSIQYDRFDGSQTPVIQREVVGRRPAAAAVLYDPTLQNLVFVEQFRVGARQWLLELVAGVVEPGDEDSDTIVREIAEETGLQAGTLVPVNEFYSSPGFLDEYIFMYCATVDSSKAAGVHGVDTEHEDIKVHAISVADARARFDAGEFTNAFTLIGLAWFFLNKDKLDQQLSQRHD